MAGPKNNQEGHHLIHKPVPNKYHFIQGSRFLSWKRTMTEAEWLKADKGDLQDYFFDNLSLRTLRLFACACCRRIWHLLTDQRSRKAVEVAESLAVDQATGEEVESAGIAAQHVLEGKGLGTSAEGAAWAASHSLGFDNSETVRSRGIQFWHTEYGVLVIDAAVQAAAPTAPEFASVKQRAEYSAIYRLLMDFGDTRRRQIPIAPSWLSWNHGTVLRLAEAIYGARDFASLPVLADALEEAGCNDPDILGHCRQSGEHFRGCWVVDLVLGKG
jgi:hypothetical protein